MSDSNTPPQLQASSELVRWLQSLALPIWARSLLVIVLVAVMFGGLSMVAWALFNQDREAMTAGIGLLTVALPVSLLVVGLVFGQRSEKRLNALTEEVLERLIPIHLQRIVCTPKRMHVHLLQRSGCRATYLIDSATAATDGASRLKFSVELNVKKVNLMFSLPDGVASTSGQTDTAQLVSHQHVIAGALAEGYQLNERLVQYTGEDGGQAMIFFRKLPDDFLLRPIEKLYFAQDLAFFVRGMVEATQLSNAKESTHL